jgi:hypothetical protein
MNCTPAGVNLSLNLAFLSAGQPVNQVSTQQYFGVKTNYTFMPASTGDELLNVSGFNSCGYSFVVQ